MTPVKSRVAQPHR
jgi:hypothetical protein